LKKYEVQINDQIYTDINDQRFFEDQTRPTFIQFIKLLLFICLGETTIEILPPNTKTTATKKQGKIANSSNTDVIVVSSKWNTISVRTEGFRVGGHFRLQPCGKERGQVKLIWVETYKKHGYIRRSKNLTT